MIIYNYNYIKSYYVYASHILAEGFGHVSRVSRLLSLCDAGALSPKGRQRAGKTDAS